jgi:two-component system NtrC family sensor kinase
MLRNSLKFKVGLYLLAALTAVVFLFTYLVIQNNRTVLLQETIDHAGEVSEMFTKSTRFAMLRNQPSYVHEIIRDVAALEDIDKVRILSKDGIVIFSSQPDEVGTMIDQEAESCLGCHLDERSMAESPLVGRPRFFTNNQGIEVLGSTAVIRNEPTCANAACHAHPASESVLGVLDIQLPLNTLHATLRQNAITIIALSLGFIVLAAALVSFLVQRIVYAPLSDLKKGAARVAGGDMEHDIPVRSHDELGELSESFNTMTRALRRSRDELEDWGHTLEQKVAEATLKLQKAQAETARSEKLASVGLLSAGIAHELNNPLTGVLTFSTLVREQMPEGSPEAEDLDLVIQETKRCAAIIRRLLDFSREKTPEMRYTDINSLILDTTQLISQSAQLADILVTTRLDNGLPQLWVDADLIKQVLMNMLVNAQHAIARKGEITIATRLCDNAHGEQDTSGQMVEISVKDTGCGIKEENLPKIFDPFFTTKGVGKGTGLGLSVSYGTIQAHGGTIEVDSEIDVGTEFRIYLPVERSGDETEETGKTGDGE